VLVVRRVFRAKRTVLHEKYDYPGMMANGHLARSIADMSFFEFRRQLEYKAAMRSGVVTVADRFYASSKTCSACRHKLDNLPLAVREWTCPSCGTVHDRDVTAAANLKNMAVGSIVAACAEEGSGPTRKRRAQPASTKQDVSFVPA
jgi:putative transposase